jgi:hypothetical protein
MKNNFTCNVCSMMGSPCPLHEREIPKEKLDVVAKALFVNFYGDVPTAGSAWYGIHPDLKEYWLDLARAAIEAYLA